MDRARDAALTNWLDDKGLRTPHPDYPGSFTYDEALVDHDEVEQWALALLENEAGELGWHDGHSEPALTTAHTCSRTCTRANCDATLAAYVARAPIDYAPCTDAGEHRRTQRHSRHSCPTERA